MDDASSNRARADIWQSPFNSMLLHLFADNRDEITRLVADTRSNEAASIVLRSWVAEKTKVDERQDHAHRILQFYIYVLYDWRGFAQFVRQDWCQQP